LHKAFDHLRWAWRVLCALSALGPASVWAAVNLELRPPSQTVVIGTTVDIGLYATSDNAGVEPVGLVFAILDWDPSFLQLTGVIDNGPYAWLSSGFPDDSGGDGINNTFTDGDAIYRAVAQFGSPAMAPPGGFLVTTLRFNAAATTTSTTVTIVPQMGITTTYVWSAIPPQGMDVTGTLGSAMATVICQSVGQCGDMNPCTDDSCTGQQCQHVANDANDPDDGLFCNGVEQACQAGMIVYQIPPPNCNDGLACTSDSCNEVQDQCVNSIQAGRCAINGVCYMLAELNPMNDCEVCDPFTNQTGWSQRPPGGACGNPANTDCDNPDTCNGAGVCLSNHEPNGLACADEGNACTGNVCGGGACLHPPGPSGAPCGSAVDNTCTDPDTCDANGVCLAHHAPNGTACDDGLFCTVTSACAGGVCQGSGNACSGQVCDEFTNACKAVNVEWRPVQSTVLEGDVVNVQIYAVSGTGADLGFGVLGAIILWDPVRLELLGHVDNGPYTWLTSSFPDDCSLDGANAPCTGLPDNDGDAYYEAVAQFSPSPPAVATPSGLRVSTMQFRGLAPGETVVELAAGLGMYTVTQVIDAETTGLDITGDIGPPTTVDVLECLNQSHCDDGAFCTGLETCVANDCMAGSYPCGSLYCDESANACVECLDASHCDNDAFCDGAEACQSGLCVVGVDPCPSQLCDEDAEVCVDCFSDMDCDDGHACTTETCVAGNCVFITNDAVCDDGQFCTGVEVCQPVTGCASLGNPCPDPVTCAEGTNNCGGCDVAVLSSEGCRYLAVDPPTHPDSIALLVMGHPSDGDTSCVALYVQSDGTLGEEPVFRTSAAWGLVHVRAAEVFPDGRYNVHTDCGTIGDPLLSAAASATTWHFGDVNHSNGVDLDDILLLLDGFSGIYQLATLYNIDLAPCVPNLGIDLDDILNVLDAFQGSEMDCPRTCFTGCDSPAVAAEGPRYLAVNPPAWPDPIGFSVTPVCPGGPVRYVAGPPSAAGIAWLVDNPAGASYLTPAEWGTVVHVTGGDIAPGGAYHVQALCGLPSNPTASAPVSVTTWGWGDLTNSGGVDIDDILCVLDAFAQDFTRCTRYACDLRDCTPDGLLDLDDILAVLDAFAAMPYTCPDACP